MSQTIQVPDPGSLLQDALKLRGRQRFQLDDFVVPTIQLGDLDCGFPPAVCRHATGSSFVSAVALERPVWRLAVPGNVLAHIRHMVFSPGTASASFRVNFVGDQITTPGNLVGVAVGFTQSRLTVETPLGIPASVFGADTQVAIIGGPWSILGVFGQPETHFYPDNWVIGTGRPGQVANMDIQQQGNVNVTGQLLIEWDEYVVT